MITDLAEPLPVQAPLAWRAVGLWVELLGDFGVGRLPLYPKWSAQAARRFSHLRLNAQVNRVNRRCIVRMVRFLRSTMLVQRSKAGAGC